ncbi:MAG: cell division protein FtsA [Candidatus Omnitrophica bacterium]|nr:cell division protein FtsA [Candidatus Omnitrophota bacterium]
MLSKMIKEKYYCGIDLGTQKIKAGILKVKDPTDMELIGAYEHKSHGFKDNAVSDLAEFSECIHHTIHELTKKTGIKFRHVQLGLGGAMIETREINTVIPLIDRGNKIITRRDIKKLNNDARLLGIKIDEEILHDLPQYYKVDDVNSALNPIGLYGRKLGVHSLMIIINGNRIRNITKAVHQAGYDVANVFFSSYATSKVVLQDTEKKGGCILIDIGSQYTSVLVFLDGILRFLEKINIGGSNFTRNIADQINLPFDLAEEIKKSYAVASGFDERKDEEILVKREDAYIPVKKGAIYQAISPVIEEFVERIRAAIVLSGLKDRINNGMTIVGGGSLLPGCIERIGQAMNMPVKLGQVNLPSRKNLNHTALFSSVVGLAQSGFKKTVRYSISSNGHSHWAKHFTNRVKDLYQEYF